MRREKGLAVSSSMPPVKPLTSSIDYTLLTPELLDKIAKTFPESDVSSQFAKDLLLALHNHATLTFFQKTFIFVAAFFPGPFSWKLAVFAFLSRTFGHVFCVLSHERSSLDRSRAMGAILLSMESPQ